MKAYLKGRSAVAAVRGAKNAVFAGAIVTGRLERAIHPISRRLPSRRRGLRRWLPLRH